MKNIKTIATAIALTLALSFSAFAGDMETGIASVPPLAAATATTPSAPDSLAKVVVMIILNLLP